MDKKKILVTGLNGLIGSRTAELLDEVYTFENLSRSSGVDITDKDQITEAIRKSDATVLVHLAAKTDVDGCEKDKDAGGDGEAWMVNVKAVEYIAQACRGVGKKLVYISTDFVFDGENTPPDGYTEEDEPFPINWYGKTKYMGEQIVQEHSDNFLILRPAYPYRVTFEQKKDFARAIIDRLKNNQHVQGVVDHIFCPMFIDDFAHALDTVLKEDAKGIYHMVGGQALSPYDATVTIAKELGFDEALISKTNRADFFQDRAERPFNLTLSNGKINALGVKMRGFDEGIREFKNS